MKTLKETIKGLVAEQLVCKNQRKSVRIVGPRTMDTWTARCKHLSNRFDLRYYYMAYGIMRGREPQVIDMNYKDLSMDRVNKIIAEFTLPIQNTEAA